MNADMIRRGIVIMLVGLFTFPDPAVAQTTLLVPSTDVRPSACVSASCSGVPRTGESTTLLRSTGPASQDVLTSPPAALVPDPYPGRVSAADMVPEPPTPTSEFQDFVVSSVGRKLPIYGYSLFDRVPSTFAPIDRVPVTADYVIGPGDELLIRAWGQIDLDAKVIVDRSGGGVLTQGRHVAGRRTEVPATAGLLQNRRWQGVPQL